MASRITQWTLDVRDVAVMARFWSQVLGYRSESDEAGTGAKLYPPDDAEPGALAVWLQPGAGAKAGKNRNHPDLNTSGDTDAEIERLLALGAQRVDVGQTGDEPFVVLSDPEGNEFCLLLAHP